MRDDDGIEQLEVVVDRALVFLDRPEVGEQLLVLALVLVASRVIGRVLWWGIDRLRRGRRDGRDGVTDPTDDVDGIAGELAGEHLASRDIGGLPTQLLRSTSAPVIGIGLAILAQRELAAAGRVTGLLGELISVFVVLFAAELIMAIISIPLDPPEARRYRRRFFKPLMWIVVGLMVLDHIADVGRLARAPVFDLFGSPISVGALFVATLGIWFWTDAINLLNTVVVSVVAKHTSLNDGSAEATLMLVRYALILIGITYGIGQLQLSPATVAAITGGLSVGVGFGLREILANFISGTFILFERSLRPGDIVEVNEQMGTVERLSVRSTTVRTIDNEEIVVPNSAFFTESFKSFTGSDEKVRFNVLVQANCRNDPEHVRSVLHDVAASHPEVLADPAPDAWVEDQFGNNVVSYRLHMWSSSPLTIPRLRSDIVRGTWAAFQAEGVELVFPDLELHFNDTASTHLPVVGRHAEVVDDTLERTWRTHPPRWRPEGDERSRHDRRSDPVGAGRHPRPT